MIALLATKNLLRNSYMNLSPAEAEDSPEWRRRIVAQDAAYLVLTILQQRGWFPDSNGNMDSLQFAIEAKVLKYVEEHEPI